MVVRTAAAFCVAASALVLAPAASAQRRIVLTPQPLNRALLALGQQSGRNILFAPESLAGFVSGPVDAADFDAALRQILARLPVRVVRQRSGVALSRRRPVDAPRMPKRAGAVIATKPRPFAAADIEIVVIGVNARQDLTGGREFVPDADILPVDRIPGADRNLAEAVARMPGVLTLATNLQGDLGGNDRAARAEGQFAAIRGLSGAYSVATIDGVVLPQSMPYGRDAQLGMLPAFGFASLQLIKTPGADRVGDATGVVLQLASPSAFDPTTPRFQIVAAGGIDDSARAYRQDAGYAQLGLRFARRFGAGDALGLALSAQVGRRAFANSQQTYQQGTVEFQRVDAAGNSPAGVDPAANLLLTTVNAQFTRGETRGGSAIAAFDYRPSPALRLFARLGFVGNWTDQDIYQLGFQGGNRAADITRTPLSDGSVALRSTGGAIHYWYQTNPERSQMLLGQVGGRARLGQSALSLRLYWGEGRTSRPDHIETSFWGVSATRLDAGVTADISNGYPIPRLSADDIALAGRAIDYPIRLQAEVRDQHSEDRRFGGDAALTRRFEDGAVRLLEAGLGVTRSRRTTRLVNLEYADLFPAGTRLGETGLVGSSIDAILPGSYDFALPLIDGARLRDRIAAASQPELTPDAANAESLDVSETVAAAFVRARIVLGPATLTPGLRAEQAWLATRSWMSGNEGVDRGGIDYGWNRDRARFGALLPSLAVRWTIGPGRTLNTVAWTSYTRPSAHQLAGGEMLDTTGAGTFQLRRGNPDLRAVRALNLDATFEWKPRHDMRASIAVFGKRLARYLYDSGSDYTNAQPDEQAGVIVIVPRNGGVARIAGVELSGNAPLARIAPMFAGWTLAAQATFLQARVRLENVLLAPVEHLQYAPDYNVSAELGYAIGDWSAGVTTRWTAAYLQQYGLFGTSASGNSVLNGSALDIWVKPSRQFDLSIARRVGGAGAVRLFVRNLLKDPAYRSTMGRYSDAVPQTIATGRLIGLRLDRRL